MIQLINGECLHEMSLLPAASCDLILCDLPYGATAPEWDSVLPMDAVWAQYNRLLAPGGVVALFGSQPFTTMLISSNIRNFRYVWYWQKNQGTNFFHASRMPIRKVEEICIFGGRRYFPQVTDGHVPTQSARGCSNGSAYHGTNRRNYEGGKTTRFPTNILEFKCVSNYKRKHSAEKPVDLLEYLIRTYTEPGMAVLDNCMGSGSTGVACVQSRRKFIGIELDPIYFAVAQDRVNQATERLHDDIC